MATVEFFPVEPWRNLDNKWKTSNRALGRWIESKWNELSQARKIAREIRRHLESIFPLLDEISWDTCPWCPEPCCIVNKVWLDFEDLLFLHLLDLRIPPAQLITGDGDACRYLTHRGCKLPRLIRPWACTLHMCPTQMGCLGRKRPSVQSEYQSTIQSIKNRRFDMVGALNRTVKSSHRSISEPEVMLH
jgi:hypothetical protein